MNLHEVKECVLLSLPEIFQDQACLCSGTGQIAAQEDRSDEDEA